MRAEELREILDRRPFKPVRLHISGGQAVDITHPEAAIVTRSLVAVGLGGPGVHEAVIHYNLLHIVKIEPLNRRKSSATRKRRRK
ncbi:MAG: hypothetical protein ACE5I3_01970 [Phycisphaerae bacterium]